ncbi:baseplate wedge tail fiber connector protein [Serratia phage SP1]|nr:baseplate wedge tail fiber connector protein [Serratia phage SP1]
MAQNTKTRIDIGRPGDASTGDVLYKGGEKINSNFDALYNAFGDERLFSTDNGVGRQTIYPSGYYQYRDANSFTCEHGGMYNVSIKSSNMNVTLPSGAKTGEKVVIINSDGSVGATRGLTIKAGQGESIIGAPNGVIVTSPSVEVVFYCVADTGGKSTWNFSVSSMFGEKQLPIEKTVALTTTDTSIEIAHKNDFDAIKFMTLARYENESAVRASEINLVIRKPSDEVFFTEYAVIKSDPNDEMIKLNFIISNAKLICVVSGLKAGVRFALKSVSTQRVTTATA